MGGDDIPTDDSTNMHPFQPIVYHDEDLEAMRQVKAKMMEDGVEESRIGLCFLAMTTIVCKRRVDVAATKYKALLDILAECGVPDGIDDELWKPEAASELKRYLVCGPDHGGCAIMYVYNGCGELIIDDDRSHAQACVMYNLAVHADDTTLRNGITCVIDSSGSKTKYLNKKVQKLHQAFPTRPKCILMAGTNKFSRIVINGMIQLAKAFSKQKVLDRIQFVEPDFALTKMSSYNAPEHLGGNGGGHESIEQWVEERLSKFPTPVL